MSPTPVVRAVVATALLSLALGGLGLSVAAGRASAADLPADDGPTSVTLVLAAPDAPALQDLATQRGLSRRARLARLAPLLPGQDTVDRVTGDLETHGLTVTDTTAWTVSVAGSAAEIRRLFGATRAAGPLPRTPAELGDDVAVVLPDSDTPVFTHHAAGALTGTDVRNSAAVAGTTPPPGTGTIAAGATIATVQFSAWDQADLSTFARQTGVPDPVASHQYTAVKVGPGATYDAQGSFEVSLDQEAILATAPDAQQRAYFAPNSEQGFVTLFAQVASDAVAHNIVALSSSWGSCEPGLTDAVLTATESILRDLTVKGVTVLSATGDHGTYDCKDGSVAVDYPASSPSVIAVGGTNLQPVGASAPNSGTNWVETAWSCASPTDCADGGSGGGSSTLFPQPVWQQAHRPATFRLVPDIAAVADPATGMLVYHEGSTVQLGGTSLASPVAAALLVNALADSGRSCGVGDIHAALYAADPSVFRDITAGNNGTDAGVGYDTVTGLGSVLWNALMPSLPVQHVTCAAPPRPVPTPPAAAPVPAAAISVAKRRKGTHPRRSRVNASWSVTNPASRIVVTVVDTTSHRTLLASGAVSGGATFKVKPRHSVRITVTAYDAAGAAHPATAAVRTPRR